MQVALSLFASLLDRHRSNNVMFWFEIRGGTLLEMTYLQVPQFVCIHNVERFLVFTGLVLKPFRL